MMIHAVIFDLDGVLCNTDQYHYQAWKELADRLGIPFNKEINHRLLGVSRMKSLEIILERSDKTYSMEEKEKLAEMKNQRYRELLLKMNRKDLSMEVKSTLDQLRERGLKLAVGSSSRNAKMILERLGLAGYFDAVSDGTNITRSKPDPEVFLCAAKMLGVEPGHCLVVEDAVAGIDAAEAGGFWRAGIHEAAVYREKCYPLNAFSDLLTLIW